MTLRAIPFFRSASNPPSALLAFFYGILIAISCLALWWILFLSEIVALPPSLAPLFAHLVGPMHDFARFIAFNLNANLLGVVLLVGILGRFEVSLNQHRKIGLPTDELNHRYQGITVMTGLFVGALGMAGAVSTEDTRSAIGHFYLKIALWILGTLWILARDTFPKRTDNT